MLRACPRGSFSYSYIYTNSSNLDALLATPRFKQDTYTREKFIRFLGANIQTLLEQAIKEKTITAVDYIDPQLFATLYKKLYIGTDLSDPAFAQRNQISHILALPWDVLSASRRLGR
jgi:hypothetical protein